MPTHAITDTNGLNDVTVAIYKHQVTLTASDIETIATGAGVELIPAQADKIILPVGFAVYKNFSTVGYGYTSTSENTNDVVFAIGWGDSSGTSVDATYYITRDILFIDGFSFAHGGVVGNIVANNYDAILAPSVPFNPTNKAIVMTSYAIATLTGVNPSDTIKVLMFYSIIEP